MVVLSDCLRNNFLLSFADVMAFRSDCSDSAEAMCVRDSIVMAVMAALDTPERAGARERCIVFICLHNDSSVVFPYASLKGLSLSISSFPSFLLVLLLAPMQRSTLPRPRDPSQVSLPKRPTSSSSRNNRPVCTQMKTNEVYRRVRKKRESHTNKRREKHEEGRLESFARSSEAQPHQPRFDKRAVKTGSVSTSENSGPGI